MIGLLLFVLLVTLVYSIITVSWAGIGISVALIAVLEIEKNRRHRERKQKIKNSAHAENVKNISNELCIMIGGEADRIDKELKENYDNN